MWVMSIGMGELKNMAHMRIEVIVNALKKRQQGEQWKEIQMSKHMK